MSTNQRDLRHWHQPKFLKHPEERLNAMVNQLRQCLDKKQSILFSCKNDQQVAWIKEELSKRLSPEELKSLIFYTNEDKASSAQVLEHKQDLEAWQGGKKQQGIALVAAGFGRGDNVGVEAVFLFDANDINDLKQKGGRTARNGEEGEVFQFYLIEEMQAEYHRLKELLQKAPGVDFASLKKSLAQVEGPTQEERLFNQIMELREYVFNLNNCAHQGYHAGLAQFSGWGMGLVGTVADPTLQLGLVGHLTAMMRRLEKQWLLCSSQPKLSPTEKVRAIEEVIKRNQKELWEEYCKSLKEIPPGSQALNFEDYPAINLSLTTQTKESLEDKNKDLALLGALVATSLGTNESEFPEKLAQLATHPKVLHAFVQEAGQFKSPAEFSNQLAIRLNQIKSPAAGYVETLKQAEVKPTPTNLFQHTDSNVAESFFNAMKKLTPSVSRTNRCLAEKAWVDQGQGASS